MQARNAFGRALYLQTAGQRREIEAMAFSSALGLGPGGAEACRVTARDNGLVPRQKTLVKLGGFGRRADDELAPSGGPLVSRGEP